MPDALLVAHVTSARMVSPSNQEVDMPIEDGYVGMVDRAVFDEWLRARAAKARSEGVAGMHGIALQMVQAALSNETRQRNPLALAFVRDGLMRADPQSYARTCEALAEAQPAAVDRITAPVLLVTGDEDAVAPPQGVRSLADRLHGSPSVRTVVLPRCGHWTPLERAEDCMREWLEFMAAVARRPQKLAGVAAH